MGAREEEVETGFEREDGGLDEVVDRRESGAFLGGIFLNNKRWG